MMSRNNAAWMSTLCLAAVTGCVRLHAQPSVTAVESSQQAAPGQQGESYYELGDFHCQVSTKSVDAQTWFDRGLAMCYAFNHEEAVRCFERALTHDPAMPMAYWGVAYAIGPYINNTEIEPHRIAHAEFALRMAQLHADRATPLERDLVAALGQRYVTPVPALEDRGPLNAAYADAMRELYRKYPDDPTVAALFAESLMILRPWQQWSPDGEPAPETPEIMNVLEKSLGRWPDHPALCHFYIHAIEASPTPEKGLPAATNLASAMPGAGHLVHMPSHIYVLMGDYDKVITSNLAAIEADKEFLRREGPYNFYTLYRAHNYHFLVYGAMFDGQSELALQAARDLVKQIPDEMLRDQVDMLEAFVPTIFHVLVRFGHWDDILAEPEPAEHLPVTRAMYRYARAIAYAATGRVPEAEAEQQAFLTARDKVPETSIIFNNTSLDMLSVAESMIAGEIAYRKGEFDAAFEHLREAVRRDDRLNYDEPWAWMQPARHALGALLLEQGRVDEAAAAYEEDLKRHPNNVWALHGLAECRQRQGDATAAEALMQRFQQASARTDVKVDRSCYCRVGAEAGEQ